MKTSSGRCFAPPSVSHHGFTLVELMVATAVTGMMVLAALGLFIQQRAVLKSNQIISEVQQNVRTGLDMLARDIRMAGYGIEESGSSLSSWIDWAQDLSGSPVTLDENPKIVDGGTEADTIWIAAAFEDPAGSLAAAAASGGTTLTLGSGEGAAFNTTDKKVAYIGKCETVRITGVAGDTLSVSSHPTSVRGLQYDHAAGSSIELVKVRSYEVNPLTGGYPYQPYLSRDDSIANSISYYWQRMISAGIEDIQFARTDDRVDIAVTGVASVKDRFHFTGENGSKQRRIEVESSVYLRNNP